MDAANYELKILVFHLKLFEEKNKYNLAFCFFLLLLLAIQVVLKGPGILSQRSYPVILILLGQSCNIYTLYCKFILILLGQRCNTTQVLQCQDYLDHLGNAQGSYREFIGHIRQCLGLPVLALVMVRRSCDASYQTWAGLECTITLELSPQSSDYIFIGFLSIVCQHEYQVPILCPSSAQPILPQFNLQLNEVKLKISGNSDARWQHRFLGKTNNIDRQLFLSL